MAIATDPHPAALEVQDAWFAHRVDMERERLLAEPRAVLRGASFSLPRAPFRAVLIGANGVGKSSLLRLCAGVGTLDRGSIAVNGKAWASERRWLTPRVAIVASGAWGGSSGVSVGEVVRGAAQRAAEAGGDSTALKEALGLRGRLLGRTTDALSDGERRRVQLFAALSPPTVEVALIDEALTELDLTIRRALYDWLRRTEKSVLLATHVFDGLEAWPPTHLVVFKDGARVEVHDYAPGTSVYEAARAALGCVQEGADDDERRHLVHAPSSSSSSSEKESPPAVQLRELSYSYDATRTCEQALTAASFRIAHGRRVVVCGANGSGKSTALALVAGARLAPLAADDAIRVLGQDPRRTNLRAEGGVALLGGAFRSGLADLPLRARNVPFRELLLSNFPGFWDDDDTSSATARARQLVQVLGVDGDWRPGTASAGQVTRMQLVLQLAPPAALYLVDELTRDLDLVARDAVLDFLRHDTVLYATHVFHGLERWATDVLHLRRGAVAHHLPDLLPSQDELPNESTLYDTVLDWLLHDEQDDDARGEAAACLPSPASASQLPPGWQARDNTVEASYGSHAFSARQAHGIFADRHATVARQKFEALYLTRR